MSQIERCAAISALALALAACGSSEEDTAETAVLEESAAETGDQLGDIMDGETAASEDAEGSEVSSSEAEQDATSVPAPSTPVVAVTEPAAFATCKVCHAVEPGQNGIGPSLAGVAGRAAGAVANFSYSPAMRAANLTWNDATLDRYLGDPSGVVPGTTMAVPGIPEADRRAIIAYLKTL